MVLLKGLSEMVYVKRCLTSVKHILIFGNIINLPMVNSSGSLLHFLSQRGLELGLEGHFCAHHQVTFEVPYCSLTFTHSNLLSSGSNQSKCAYRKLEILYGHCCTVLF